MDIRSTQEYNKAKIEFLQRSDDWKVETSPMDEYGQYVKTYICSNGDALTEVNRPVYENVDVEVRGLKMQVQVKLFESEMFSNRFSSIYTYEKF